MNNETRIRYITLLVIAIYIIISAIFFSSNVVLNFNDDYEQYSYYSSLEDGLYKKIPNYLFSVVLIISGLIALLAILVLLSVYKKFFYHILTAIEVLLIIYLSFGLFGIMQQIALPVLALAPNIVYYISKIIYKTKEINP